MNETNVLTERECAVEKDLLYTRLFQIMRAIWVIMIVIAVCLIVYFVVPLILPFIIGWIIAYILNPVVNFLNFRVRLPRWLATTVAMITLFGIATAFITLLVSKIVVEIGKLSKLVSDNIGFWIDDFISFIKSDRLQMIVEQILSFYSENEKYMQTIDQNINNIGERLTNAVTTLIGYIFDFIFYIVVSLPNFTFIFVIAILAAFFISKDWHKLIQWFFSLFPVKIKDSTRNVWHDLQRALFGYIRAQLIMISITAVFIIIGLMVLKVDYALSIGLLIGLIDLLPYLGVGLVMVPWIIYAFIQGDLILGLGLSILYGIVLIVRSSIEPKVLASSIGLNALATLVAMVIGLKLFNVAGIIIGPVTLIFLLALQRTGVYRDLKNYIQGTATNETD